MKSRPNETVESRIRRLENRVEDLTVLLRDHLELDHPNVNLIIRYKEHS